MLSAPWFLPALFASGGNESLLAGGGGGFGFFNALLLDYYPPQFTSCCHGAASFGNGMPYSGGSWRAHASVPHHKIVEMGDIMDDVSK